MLPSDMANGIEDSLLDKVDGTQRPPRTSYRVTPAQFAELVMAEKMAKAAAAKTASMSSSFKPVEHHLTDESVRKSAPTAPDTDMHPPIPPVPPDIPPIPPAKSVEPRPMSPTMRDFTIMTPRADERSDFQPTSPVKSVEPRPMSPAMRDFTMLTPHVDERPDTIKLFMDRMSKRQQQIFSGRQRPSQTKQSQSSEFQMEQSDTDYDYGDFM